MCVCWVILWINRKKTTFKKAIVSSKFWLNLKVVDDPLKTDIYLKNYTQKAYIYGSNYFYIC